MKPLTAAFCLLLMFNLLSIPQTNVLAAAESPVSQPAPPPPLRADELWLRGMKPVSVEKSGPGQFAIGDIRIDKTQLSISFPGVVNMEKGALEYLLVRTGGKTHESLLRTASEPYNLQLAFLLLGFEGTDQPLTGQGDPVRPRGEAVEIALSFQDGEGKINEIFPEQWLVIKNDTDTREVKSLDWVYTGSITARGRFLAQSEGSIVAIFHDPAAMIDNASDGGGSDKIWIVKEGAVPPIGTSVTITIKAKNSWGGLQ